MSDPCGCETGEGKMPDVKLSSWLATLSECTWKGGVNADEPETAVVTVSGGDIAHDDVVLPPIVVD